jgi:hypothetical protein
VTDHHAKPQEGRTISRDELVPDEHGNSYITFGDGTGAVHTAEGWFLVEEDDPKGSDDAIEAGGG